MRWGNSPAMGEEVVEDFNDASKGKSLPARAG
jgi:hypothetical protein